MTFLDKLRGLFGSGGSPSRDDESAEQEEYGLQDKGEAELRGVEETGTSRTGFVAGEEAARAAEDDLDSFRPPRDPSP